MREAASEPTYGTSRAVGLGILVTGSAALAGFAFRTMDSEDLSAVQTSLFQTGLILLFVAAAALLLYLLWDQTTYLRNDRADKHSAQRSYRRRIRFALDETATVAATLRDEPTVLAWSRLVPGPLAAIRTELHTLEANLTTYELDDMPLFPNSAAICAQLRAAGEQLDMVLAEFEQQADSLAEKPARSSHTPLPPLPALEELLHGNELFPTFERELHQAIALIDAKWLDRESVAERDG